MPEGQGEAVSLNPAARDYALRLAGEQGRLPLGAPLPYPHDDGGEGNANANAFEEDEDDDVEWTNENEEATQDVSAS